MDVEEVIIEDVDGDEHGVGLQSKFDETPTILPDDSVATAPGFEHFGESTGCDAEVSSCGEAALELREVGRAAAEPAQSSSEERKAKQNRRDGDATWSSSWEMLLTQSIEHHRLQRDDAVGMEAKDQRGFALPELLTEFFR